MFAFESLLFLVNQIFNRKYCETYQLINNQSLKINNINNFYL
jgi:hypothetical protein